MHVDHRRRLGAERDLAFEGGAAAIQRTPHRHSADLRQGIVTAPARARTAGCAYTHRPTHNATLRGILPYAARRRIGPGTERHRRSRAQTKDPRALSRLRRPRETLLTTCAA